MPPAAAQANIATREGLMSARLLEFDRTRPAIILTALTLLLSPGIRAGVTLTDISPDESELYKLSTAAKPSANGSSGRVNNLASAAGPAQSIIFYAASEWGGLFKSTDGGLHWSHLEGHVPVVAQDVSLDRTLPSIVYATSQFDGRVHSRSGIQVSTDAGATWTHPATAVPLPGANAPANFTCSLGGAPQEPAAFGIGLRPDAAGTVVIGTNCGVAISNDFGATWRFRDPTPATPAAVVWDVTVQSGGALGIIDICGDDGHWRSVDGGESWTGGAMWWNAGSQCSIAASPDESDVLFITEKGQDLVYETDDGGANGNASWNPIGGTGRPPASIAVPKNRIPFVVTNDRSDSGGTRFFDLWFGDEEIFRVTCQSPSAPGSYLQQRCDAPSAWFEIPLNVTYHGDMGDLEFDPAASIDACPVLTSSDGGVYYQDPAGLSLSACQSPEFSQPLVSPHAPWLWGMDGANPPGDSVDLYFGAQDIGGWGATDAQNTPPATWSDATSFGDGGDAMDMAADPARVVGYHLNGLYVQNPGLTGGGAINLPAACEAAGGGTGLVRFRFAPQVARFDDKKYAILCECGGVYVTEDITAVDGGGNPAVAWTQIGAGNTPPDPCGIRVATSPGNPTQPVFYLQARQLGTRPGACWQWTDLGNGCNGGASDKVGDGLYRYDGIDPNQVWQRLDTGSVTRSDGSIETMSGGIGVFGVDPADAARLYASNLRSAPLAPRMVSSSDGGASWHEDADLDRMMTGDGEFYYRAELGPTPFGGFNGYPQPSLVAFDRDDPGIVVAGGRDAGLFLSTNGGADWGLLTDPIDPGTSGVPHIPRPWFAHFKHDAAGTIWLYVGSQGGGVWRLGLRPPTASAGGPYGTPEGMDVTLDATGSTDPDGETLVYAWDLDGDGEFDDATGPSPAFASVGQDGVFPVSVKVSAGGVFSIDSTTVTVTNVAPSILATSDAPVDEGATVHLNGIVSDPGWLDPLTATIAWGDGGAAAPISGTLEQAPPDATLTFSLSHVLGDNGTFTATICATDDDVTTCQSLPLEVRNVDPTAEIDESGTILVNGMPTFITKDGEVLDLAGRSTDPGSDDLTLTWDWDDGPPAPDVTTASLVNPPNPDPFPSPSLQPRDVTDSRTHAFADACLYQIGFRSQDDDGGLGVDGANVIVVGRALATRSAGYWKQQYASPLRSSFDAGTLQCYLDIAGYMSQVFHEVRNASTVAAAAAILADPTSGSLIDALDRQMLAAWLNFANGSVALSDLVDTHGNKALDGTFGDAMALAEAVRLNPASTRSALREQKDRIERINLRDEK
jgi:hypothetical protein